MDKELAAADRNNHDPGHKAKARMAIWEKYNDLFQKQTESGARSNLNGLTQAILSGARGKMPQLKMMTGATGLYQDSFGNAVPLFGRSSFAEGLRPAEYLAPTYGARETVTGAKTAVAKGGYLGKLAVSATSGLVVTDKDCGTSNGLDLKADDDSLYGRVLLHPVAGYSPGTLITGKVLSDIKKSGQERVFVRSALTCNAEHGLCAKCAGAVPGGKLANVGDHVGITSAQASRCGFWNFFVVSMM